MQISKPRTFATIVFLSVPASVFAQMSCAALGDFLATQPYVSPANAQTPLTTLTATAPNARCEANFAYSEFGR